MSTLPDGCILEYNKPFLNFLSNYIKENKIANIFDYGCGEFSLLQHFNFNGLKYFGVDRDSKIIENNDINHRKSNIKFFCEDITKYTIEKPCDLIIIKDVFAHMPNHSILQTLFNLRKYSKILVVTDFSSINTETSDGGYRGVNLNIWPYYANADLLLEYKCNNTVKKCMLIDGKKMFPDCVLN